MHIIWRDIDIDASDLDSMQPSPDILSNGLSSMRLASRAANA